MNGLAEMRIVCKLRRIGGLFQVQGVGCGRQRTSENQCKTS